MSRTLKVCTLALLALALAGCARMEEQAEDLASDESMDRTMQEPRRIEVQREEPKVQKVTVPAGTQIPIEMKKSLDSSENQPGDPLAARVLEDVSVDGRVVIPAGTGVRGVVKDVKAAKRGAGEASMTLAFNRLVLPDDTSMPIAASLSQQTDSMKKKNAAVIGGSAAGGALLGRIIGKDTKGAVVGAIVGGAIGTGVVMGRDGGQIKIPRGTELVIQLDDHLQIAQR